MNIQEATRMAIEKDSAICRKSIRASCDTRFAVIRPTNSYETCKIITYQDGEEISSCRCWNPTADDLTADDWEMFKE